MEMGEVFQTQPQINKVLLSQYGIQYVGMKPERKKRQSREKEKKNREKERVCLRSTKNKIGRQKERVVIIKSQVTLPPTASQLACNYSDSEAVSQRNPCSKTQHPGNKCVPSACMLCISVLHHRYFCPSGSFESSFFSAAHIQTLLRCQFIYLFASKMPAMKRHLQPFKPLNVISQLDFILFRYKFKSIRLLPKLTASDLILNEPGRNRDRQTDHFFSSTAR